MLVSHPLCKHGYRDDAADIGTKLAWFANRVHHFAQQVGIAELVRSSTSSFPLNDFPAELLNLWARHLAEVGIKSFAALQLFAVDQQGSGPRNGIAILVVVPEQGAEVLAVLLIASFILNLIA